RREAFQRTLAQLGLPEGATIDCRWDPDRASRTVSELPASSGITAVLADDDVLAAGAIRGAGESGRQVPEDLSVTGWGDLPLGAWMHPSLTTVRIDHHRHGVELLEELLRVMRGDDPSMDRPSITEVLWRESTGPAPDRARKRGCRPLGHSAPLPTATERGMIRCIESFQARVDRRSGEHVQPSFTAEQRSGRTPVLIAPVEGATHDHPHRPPHRGRPRSRRVHDRGPE